MPHQPRDRSKQMSLIVLSLILLMGAISACQPSFHLPDKAPLSTVPCNAAAEQLLFKEQAQANDQGPALLYVAQHDQLYAIDGRRRVVLWCRRLVHTDNPERRLAPEFAALRRSGHSLYSGTSSGLLVALDADSGQVRWVANNYSLFEDQDWVAPTVDEQRQLIYGVDSRVGFYAVGSVDGKVRWQQDLSQGLPAQAQVVPELVPKVSGNVAVAAVPVFLGPGPYTGNVLLLGVEAQTGRRLWEHLWPLGKNLNLEKPLEVERGVIGLVLRGEGLLGIRAIDGKLLWEIKLQGVSSPRLAGAADGVFYLQTEKGEKEVLWAVDATSGQVRWKATIEERGDLLATVGDQALYLSSLEGVIDALEVKSGKLLWKQQLVANEDSWVPMSWPIVEGNTVYVLTSGVEARGPYVLHAVSHASGQEEWAMIFGDEGDWIVPVLGA
uniref:Pyrrolo-quinoline quinone repeat domain-containing protein n=1 Tax=Thermogemmatispora argillosa TaxID=2045280 RepID=A0A455SZK9_9CHLR|nr:hypothetical protein KTA_12170 [Thermogemmatispora argillosa]